jgi:hypothetical protein
MSQGDPKSVSGPVAVQKCYDLVLWLQKVRSMKRGGSFNNDRGVVRCAYRNRNNARNRNNNTGFRCVRDVGPAMLPVAGVVPIMVCASVRPAHIRTPHLASPSGCAEDQTCSGAARSPAGRALPRGAFPWSIHVRSTCN